MATTEAAAGWKLSLGEFLALQRRFKFPAQQQQHTVQVVFSFNGVPMVAVWLKPLLMQYKPYRLVATFEVRGDFIASSYYPEAKVFVAELKPEQVKPVVEAFALAYLSDEESAKWQDKLASGKDKVECQNYSGSLWV